MLDESWAKEPENIERISRLKELRRLAAEEVRSVGRGRTFNEHIEAIALMLARPGVPAWEGLTTARGLAHFARSAVRDESAPREPDVPTPGDGLIEGGKRRRVIKGEFPGQHSGGSN